MVSLCPCSLENSNATSLAWKTELEGQERTPGSCRIWETPAWSCQADRNEDCTVQERSRLETLPSQLPRMKGDKISTGELIGREEEKQKCDQCSVSNKAWNTEIHPSVSRTAETSIAASGEKEGCCGKGHREPFTKPTTQLWVFDSSDTRTWNEPTARPFVGLDSEGLKAKRC